MKKLVLSIICVAGVAGVAFAQGTVNWSVSAGAMTAQTNSQTYSPLFGGGSTGNGAVGSTGSATTSGLSYYYELLYNTSFTGSQATIPGLNSLLGGTWLDAGLSATNSVTASRITPIAGNSSAVVPWSNGTTNNIMLVGWSANLGTTWLSASNYLANWATLGSSVTGNAFFGESATGYISPNLAPASGASLFNSTATANGLPIFSLNTQLYLIPVPEPGTIALATLGGLSMLALRRRKA